MGQMIHVDLLDFLSQYGANKKIITEKAKSGEPDDAKPPTQDGKRGCQMVRDNAHLHHPNQPVPFLQGAGFFVFCLETALTIEYW
jgi:hypothetical protein